MVLVIDSFKRAAVLPLAILLALAAPASGHQGLHEEIRRTTLRIMEKPASPLLYLRRGEAHRIHGDFGLAIDDYRAARGLDPGLVVTDLCVGRALLDLGLPLAALPALDRFLLERPSSPEGHFWRGTAAFRLGDLEWAAEDFGRAIDCYPAAAPPPPDLYLKLASALAARGGPRIDAALRRLEDGLERLGRPIALELAALELELARDRYPEALRRLERLSDGSPRKEVWLQKTGMVLEAAGRPGEARAAYARALEAIEALPSHRRRTPLVLELEAEVRASLAGNGAPHS
jgi:tetratricopeptide (TPR) repeat protein